MPRKKRLPSPTGVYHWICRGIHKKDIFHKPTDYEFFKSLLKEYALTFEIQIYHYCLMTNHVHLLILSPTLEGMAKFSQMVQRRYAYHYCGAYRWVGNVFQRGYRSLAVDKDAYLLECGRHIERNPLKAVLAEHPASYKHSSFRYYGCGDPDDLITMSPTYLGLASTEDARIAIYNEYVCETRVQEDMAGAKKVPF